MKQIALTIVACALASIIGGAQAVRLRANVRWRDSRGTMIPARYLNLEWFTCLGVTCALVLLLGFFVWLIIENLVGVR